MRLKPTAFHSRLTPSQSALQNMPGISWIYYYPQINGRKQSWNYSNRFLVRPPTANVRQIHSAVFATKNSADLCLKYLMYRYKYFGWESTCNKFFCLPYKSSLWSVSRNAEQWNVWCEWRNITLEYWLKMGNCCLLRFNWEWIYLLIAQDRFALEKLKHNLSTVVVNKVEYYWTII